MGKEARSRRRLIRGAVGLAIVLAAFAAGKAVAQLEDEFRAGRAFVRVTGYSKLYCQVQTQADPQVFTSTTWTNLPMSTTRVDVPSGISRMVLARFSGESQVYNVHGNTAPRYGTVRIVAQDPRTGAITQLSPTAGTDFAFDSSDYGSERPRLYDAAGRLDL